MDQWLKSFIVQVIYTEVYVSTRACIAGAQRVIDVYCHRSSHHICNAKIVSPCVPVASHY